MHGSRRLRQKDCRLSGGVSSSDDDYFFALAELRRDERRAIIDSRAFELLDVLQRQLPVLGAARDDHRASVNQRPIVDRDAIGSSGAIQFCRRFGDHQLGAELLRLRKRARGELGSGDSRRKSEIILDT